MHMYGMVWSGLVLYGMLNFGSVTEIQAATSVRISYHYYYYYYY